MFKPENTGKASKPGNKERASKLQFAEKNANSRNTSKDVKSEFRERSPKNEFAERTPKPAFRGRVTGAVNIGRGSKPAPTSEVKKIPTFEVREITELLPFIMDKLQGISRNSAKSYCSLSFIRVDDRIEKRPNTLLKPGQIVTIDKNSRKNAFKHPMLDIVYEDAFVIVVNKKEGLLSVSATESDREVTAHKLLQEYVKKKDKRNRVFVVHRLDRETSGLMMFVKTAEIQQAFRNNWKQVVYERSYVAVVEGRIKKEYDTIHSWIKENKDFLNYSSLSQGDGQEAITHYKVIKRGATRTLIDVHLETGRKNQIRVHMHDIEHSIVGDQKYGIPGSDPIGRLCLHAKVLSFYHPKTNELKHFETPVPKSFLSLIK
ncbi:MAG: RluA family pseudouridine synthase [Bacteroidales bacterium]|nr:RluA family pseudouridine synthase [Bacteroidales bacterium]MDD4823324.1 RluA family pseudouridine synthase [Bacteroidales bacterium]